MSPAADDEPVARRQAQFPWVLASLGAAFVVVGGAVLLRFPAAPDPKRIASGASEVTPMQMSRLGNGIANTRLQEELALQDPTPLFGPTRWNSGQAPQPVMPEPGSAFVSFQPDLIFPDNDPSIAMPPPVTVPPDALAAVDLLEKEPKLIDLARLESPLPPVPRRLVQVEVSEVSSGETKLRQDVADAAGIESPTGLRLEFWIPVEMMVAINPAGLVGRPVIVASSGSEGIDNWALEFLTARAHLGARLGPGFYRVIVGP